MKADKARCAWSSIPTSSCPVRSPRRVSQRLSSMSNELRSTLQKPRVAQLVKLHKAGRLVNQVKKLAEDIDPLPRVVTGLDDFAVLFA